MADVVSKLAIMVVPSPETNDHEVRLLDGDSDIIARFEEEMIGLDPGRLLTSSCSLLPGDAPHVATIARCGCGITECGSVEVVIERKGDIVTWRDPQSSIAVRFSAEQYETEVRRALADLSWETPDRTAARLISSRVQPASLQRSGFTYMWSSGRILDGHMTISLLLVPGPHQVLLHVVSAGLSPDQMAQRCLETLDEEPSSWANVVWYPQAEGLQRPALAGAGWRKGT